MALYELSIYGENDEVIKKYETNIVRWKVLVEAVELEEELAGKGSKAQILAINELIKKVFPGLTDEELYNADKTDIFSTFNQLTAGANKINGGHKKND